jgi:hypothetical protein
LDLAGACRANGRYAVDTLRWNLHALLVFVFAVAVGYFLGKAPHIFSDPNQ